MGGWNEFLITIATPTSLERVPTIQVQNLTSQPGYRCKKGGDWKVVTNAVYAMLVGQLINHSTCPTHRQPHSGNNHPQRL